MEEIKYQYLEYRFEYDGETFDSYLKLDEDEAEVEMMFDDHDLEETWIKTIEHNGKRLCVSIVIKDDWNEPETLGNVVASGWVCVYDANDNMLCDFEPEWWAYIDEDEPEKSVNKETYYNVIRGSTL